MIKIIGIGGCGSNILEFIKKQNLQDKKSNYKFISIKNDSDVDSIDYNKDDTVITISGFGGNTAGKLTNKITRDIIDNKEKIKNIIVLPFGMEFTIKQAIEELEQLVSINQNIEIFANDDISNETNQDKTMSELMKEYDKIIFDTVTKENQREMKSFFIDIEKNNKIYKAIINFWSKSYKITLVEPKCKMIDNSSIGNIANNRFDFHQSIKLDSDKYIVDIEEVAINKINEYIENEK